MVSESRFYAGLMLEPTTEWTSGVVGGPYAIYEMSARSRPMRQRRMITFLEGTIEGFYQSRGPDSYDGEIWTFIRGTYHTGRDAAGRMGECRHRSAVQDPGSPVWIGPPAARAKVWRCKWRHALQSRILRNRQQCHHQMTYRDTIRDDWTDEQMRALVLVFRKCPAADAQAHWSGRWY